MGFSAAGSYGDWMDSFDTNGTKADYWTGGLAYETGPVGASVTYLYSDDKNTGYQDKFQDVSFGVDYKLAPGLTPFAEYTWYDIDPTGTGSAGLENKGNIVLVGSQLSF
jgi:predicted porin